MNDMWRTRVTVALLSLILFSGLPPAALCQENPPSKRPAHGAQIVRIEYGSESGMCYGYCYNQTVIQAEAVRSTSRTNYSLNGNGDREKPDKKTKRKISAEQWERAKAAVDTESLFALPDRIGCPGCVDEPVDWITVNYSDGTEKTVLDNSGGPPTDMADKIKAALASTLSPRK